MGRQCAPDLVVGMGRQLRDPRNGAVRFGRLPHCRYGECDSARAQPRGHWARAIAGERHPSGSEIRSTSTYRRLALLVDLPAPLVGERLSRRGSICASTDPAKDRTCLLDNFDGFAKPTPASCLTLREVFGDGGLLVVLAMIGTPGTLEPPL
jgi:hypothetical protein